MSNFILGIFYMVIAQAGTFIQLQGNAKFGWYTKYPILLLLSGIPLTWLYIKSVEKIVNHFGGEIWPSRIIGFGVGVMIFALMSFLLFREPITFKTLFCLLLSFVIILIQIFVK
jgi:hypothetical protein